MPKKIRVLMLNYEFPPIGGGAGNAHLNMLKIFAKRSDLDVDVLTSSLWQQFTIEQFSDNIKIHKVGIHKKNLHYWTKLEVIEWLFKARFQYKKMLRASDYDVIHAFFAFPSAWLCYKTDIPYIVSLRGSDVPGYNVRLGLDYKLLSGLFRRIWNNAAMVLANSDGLRNLANKFTPDLDIGVIPNGVDTEKYFPSPQPLPVKPFKLLTVCRLISRKRIDLLIDAAAKVRNAGGDVILNIAGEGNLTDELKQQAQKLGISSSVNFLGRVSGEDMPKVYRESNCFIMASAHEGMSNAMLEAMASGLPIITTKCEGVEELIDGNGIVVENNSADGLAEAVIKLAGIESQYRQMAAASRMQAEKFSWKAAAERYIECYNKVISQRLKNNA